MLAGVNFLDKLGISNQIRFACVEHPLPPLLDNGS